MPKHAATLYGIAKATKKIPSGWKLTTAKVKLVTNESIELMVMTCRGDLCEMHNASYPFRPPLKNLSELSKRIDSIKSRVCAPRWYWLVTKPVAFVVLISCIMLGYGSWVLEVDGMVDLFAQAPRLEAGIGTIFGSTTIFAYIVLASWYFAIFAHSAEAFWTLYHSNYILKLGDLASYQWFFMVLLVGFPVTSEFILMLRVAQASSKEK